MAAHHRAHALGRAEELVVRQLVNLIGADAADARVLQVPLEVVLRGAEEAHARAREGDLRGRRHSPEAVRVAFLRCDIQNRQDFREVLGQGVHGVGVIPHDAEIRRAGLHAGEAAGLVFRNHGAGGVSEHRHYPHALDCRIRYQLFDGLYIRPVLLHWHCNQLEAELLRDGKVTVVARHRANPLELFFLAPRLRGIIGAEEKRPRDQVEHDVQRGRVCGHEQLWVHVGQLAPDIAQFFDALLVAVVTQVVSGRIGVMARAGQRQQIIGEVQLCLGRLSAGQVQFQALSLKVLVVLTDLGGELREFGRFQSKKRHAYVYLPCIGRLLAPNSNARHTKRGPRAPARAS